MSVPAGVVLKIPKQTLHKQTLHPQNLIGRLTAASVRTFSLQGEKISFGEAASLPLAYVGEPRTRFLMGKSCLQEGSVILSSFSWTNKAFSKWPPWSCLVVSDVTEGQQLRALDVCYRCRSWAHLTRVWFLPGQTTLLNNTPPCSHQSEQRV